MVPYENISALATLLACVVYPWGWGSGKVREICLSYSYDPGVCELGSGFILALVLVFDHFCLSLFGFMLTIKQPLRTSEI
ncbi:unnamed protein product, partial [Toxocara canis]|uniref:G_PROTEIN_RECEP_F1_2 domain-containing protein n=1 Tax=Toxocara canis TaxID=6265 RepID=A0A183U963_TOXCA